MMQVTECKYSVSLLRYDPYSYRMQFVPTCPVFAGPGKFFFFGRTSDLENFPFQNMRMRGKYWRILARHLPPGVEPVFFPRWIYVRTD